MAAFTYPVTLSDGRQAAIDSDRELSGDEVQQGLDGFNSQIASQAQAANARAQADQQAGRLASYGGTAVRDFVSPLASSVRGVGEMLDSPALIRGGNELEQDTATALPSNPQYSNDAAGKIIGSTAGLAGGVLPFALPLGIGEVAGPASVVAQTYDSGLREGLNAGLPLSTAQDYARTHVALQAPLQIAGGRLVRGLVGAAPATQNVLPTLSNRLADLGTGALEAGGIGATSQLASNLQAGNAPLVGYNIDPNRGALDDVLSNGALMAGSAGLLGLPSALLRGRAATQTGDTTSSAQPDAPVVPAPDAASTPDTATQVPPASSGTIATPPAAATDTADSLPQNVLPDVPAQPSFLSPLANKSASDSASFLEGFTPTESDLTNQLYRQQEQAQATAAAADRQVNVLARIRAAAQAQAEKNAATLDAVSQAAQTANQAEASAAPLTAQALRQNANTTLATVSNATHAVPDEPAPISPYAGLVGMTGDDLADHYNTVKAGEQDDDVAVFGQAGAKKYRNLLARENNLDPRISDPASAERQRMEDALTDAQRNQLFGIGQTGANADEVRDVRDAVSYVEGARNEQELGEALKFAATKFDPSVPPADYTFDQAKAAAQMLAARRVTQQLGLDPVEVGKQMVSQAARRFSDPQDAADMLGQWVKALQPEAPAQSTPRLAAQDVTPPPSDVKSLTGIEPFRSPIGQDQTAAPTPPADTVAPTPQASPETPSSVSAAENSSSLTGEEDNARISSADGAELRQDRSADGGSQENTGSGRPTSKTSQDQRESVVDPFAKSTQAGTQEQAPRLDDRGKVLAPVYGKAQPLTFQEQADANATRYNEAQDAIDAELKRLKANGVNTSKMYAPSPGAETFAAKGYKPMPDSLLRLLNERNEIADDQRQNARAERRRIEEAFHAGKQATGDALPLPTDGEAARTEAMGKVRLDDRGLPITTIESDPTEAKARSLEQIQREGGHKLHLATDQPEAVSQYLTKNGLAHKVGRSGGQEGKDITVYTGSRDATDLAASKISRDIGPLLNEPHGDTLSDDTLYAPKVMGRFDVPRSDTEFHQYGAEGVPFKNADVQDAVFGGKTKDRAQMREEADAALRAKYGEFYAGSEPVPRLDSRGKPITTIQSDPTEAMRASPDVEATGDTVKELPPKEQTYGSRVNTDYFHLPQERSEYTRETSELPPHPNEAELLTQANTALQRRRYEVENKVGGYEGRGGTNAVDRVLSAAYIKYLRNLREGTSGKDGFKPSEVGQVLNNVIRDFQKGASKRKTTVALDAPTADGGRTVGDSVPDDAPTPSEAAARTDAVGRMRTVTQDFGNTLDSAGKEQLNNILERVAHGEPPHEMSADDIELYDRFIEYAQPRFEQAELSAAPRDPSGGEGAPTLRTQGQPAPEDASLAGGRQGTAGGSDEDAVGRDEKQLAPDATRANRQAADGLETGSVDQGRYNPPAEHGQRYLSPQQNEALNDALTEALPTLRRLGVGIEENAPASRGQAAAYNSLGKVALEINRENLARNIAGLQSDEQKVAFIRHGISEEVTHLADIQIDRDAWNASGRKIDFDDFVSARKTDLLNGIYRDVEKANPRTRALLQGALLDGWNLYHDQAQQSVVDADGAAERLAKKDISFSFETPDELEKFLVAHPDQVTGYMMETLRQLVQLRETDPKITTEASYLSIYEELKAFVNRILEKLRAVAADPKAYSKVLADAINQIERVKNGEPLDFIPRIRADLPEVRPVDRDLVRVDAPKPIRTRDIAPGASRTDIVRQAEEEIDARAQERGGAIKQFVEGEVKGRLSEGLKVATDAASSIRNLIAPTAASVEAKQSARTLRGNLGKLAADKAQARVGLDAAIKAFDKLDMESAAGQKQSLQFQSRMEQGLPQATPELTRIASLLRAALDARRALIQSLGTGKLQNFITDYFPHIWKSPEGAEAVMKQVLGKSPLEGSKNFLKERSIDSVAAGVAMGLEPVSWNPIEQTLLKLHEMDRYLMAQRTVDELRAQGLATPVSDPTVPPANGQAKVRLGGAEYVMSADAARPILNYLSPGLRGNALYDALRYGSGLLNSAQLGLSAFHLGFVSVDSTTSKMSLGLTQIARGVRNGDVYKAGQGLANIFKASIPGYAPVEALLQGSKVLREYTKPGSVGGEFAGIADALQQGGGRINLDAFENTGAGKAFRDAIRKGNYIGALLRAPMAAVDFIPHLIGSEIVPRFKVAAFADLAREEMERLGPSATLDQKRQAYAKAWDSVDNRLGQVVYDNLFWNKSLKDTLMLTTRSVGWNLGTIREIGGGLLDTATVAQRIKSGDPVLTARMSYIAGLTMTSAMLGGMIHYLYNGKGPDDLKDYFFPRTGKTKPDGTAERLQLPSYVKDILAYKHAPLQTLLDKQSPLISQLVEMYQNKDFYGNEIRNGNDPFVQQIMQEAKFIGSGFVPFQLRASQQRQKQDTLSKVESFFGVTPAPAKVSRTDAQNLMVEKIQERQPSAGKTPEEAQRAQLRKELMTSAGNGDNISSQLNDAVKSGQLTRQAASTLIRNTHVDPNLRMFRALDVTSARQVFDVATPEEKKLFLMPLRMKEAKAGVPLTALAVAKNG